MQKNTRDKEYVSLQVAQFEPNAWGLYDMHGNVEEWCYDYYDDTEFRSVRGGSHNTPVRYLRSANRSASVQADRSVLLGFRVVESPRVTRRICGGLARHPAAWPMIARRIRKPVFLAYGHAPQQRGSRLVRHLLIQPDRQLQLRVLIPALLRRGRDTWHFAGWYTGHGPHALLWNRRHFTGRHIGHGPHALLGHGRNAWHFG